MRFSLLFLHFFSIAIMVGQNPRFDHYGVDDGLAQSVALCIYQDSEGYLWFGTQSGVSQFDGYEFINHYTIPSSRTSLSNTWIYNITEDNKGNLYLGTKGGINKYDKRKNKFSQIPYKAQDDPVIDNFIYGLTCDGEYLYVNTPPAISIINLESGEKRRYFNEYEYDGALRDLGFPIIKADDGKLWIGSHNGLSSFDLKTREFTNYTHNKNDTESLCDNHVTALFEENNGDIVIGTEHGLNVFRQKTKRISRLKEINKELSNSFVRDVIRDNNNELWIATEGGGLNKIKTDSDYNALRSENFRSEQQFLNHDILYSLYLDYSDNLWIGSLAGIDKTNLSNTGIELYANANTQAPHSYNLLDNVIASVYQDEYDRLWIGNWGKGLNILDFNNKKTLHYTSEYEGRFHIPENHLQVIFEDSKKRTWIGTRDGVSIYNKETEAFNPAHEVFNVKAYDCFRNTRVYSMMEDHEGNMWIATGNGIYVLKLNSRKLITLRADGISDFRINSNLVYSIIQDSENEIWIATSQGLNRFNPSSGEMYEYHNQPSSFNTIVNEFTISLYEDYLGYIWIGTGTGLSRFSKKDSLFISFTTRDGLPSNIIYDIIDDNEGNLWFSTGSGIASLDPKEAETGNFRIIEQLRGQEFNIRAIHKSEQGKLFFGGMNGLIAFYPDSLNINQFIPPVRITSIEKENEGIRHSLNTYQDKIVLSHKDYAFTIEFTALDYTDSEKNRYAFMMKGISDNWVEIGTRHFVHFTNLPPGSYTFQVKGSNNDGVWNPRPTSLDIIINPPWWLSDYAIASYIIFLIFIIILIIYLRERKLIREKKILEDKVRIRTSEIARQKELVEESEQRLSSTINSLDDLVFVLDERGMLQEFYNPRKRKTHLIFPELHVGNHYKNISFPLEVNKHLDKAYDYLSEKDAIVEFDHPFQDDGRVYWYNTKISPKRNPEGKLNGLVIVARDITDRKESEEKLTRQKEELDELNAMKDKFFSILAHDLKNPFTNLYSMGDLIVKNFKVLEEEEKIEALKKMHKSTEFIYNLLENLLTWSRTQRGSIEYNPGIFDLSKLIDININLHKIPAEKKGISLVSSVDQNITAFGDREMINTVIRNLINNAIKFSSRGGKIEVKVISKNGFLEVCVADQGTGISLQDQEKLFRIDVKYKSKGTAGETGTGLGLALCKEFIDKHEGNIWCESEEGMGTRFYFTIPKMG